MRNKIQLRFGIIALMIVLAALSRLLPHPPNFTPIGGMALFGAAYFSRRYWAFIIPFLALFASDLILNNVVYAQYYEGFVWFSASSLWIYGSFALIVLLGVVGLRKGKPLRLLGGSLTASVLFFVITNFGAWASNPLMYNRSADGLLACYAAGLPFFWNTVAGDLFYVALLFGAFEWVNQRYLRPQAA